MINQHLPKWLISSILGVFGLLLGACGSSSTGPGDRDHIVAGVNLTQLLAHPTPAELNAVQALWMDRDVTAQNIREERAAEITLGETPATLRVVSHTVDGVRHYGAILGPNSADPGSLPILIYAHESDDGINVDALLPSASLVFGILVDQFVIVVPSYRSERLVADGMTFISEGDPSPFDRDVDDALSLLEVALATTPSADPTRIGAVGFSRGATVAMMMAIRDPRIDLVVGYYGPTDFLGPFVEELIIEALEDNPRDLPGLNNLYETVVEPLRDGSRDIDYARSELIRRSPVHFAADLPPLQLHHNRGDQVVPVGETERLEAVMGSLGTGEPEFEAHYYSSSLHFPSLLSLGLTREFLSRLVQQPALSFAIRTPSTSN